MRIHRQNLKKAFRGFGRSYLVPACLLRHTWQDWDLVSTYPNAFRSLVPVFTKYTDAAFPTDDPVDTTSRVALR